MYKRQGTLCFCFGNPIKQESDFLLNVPDNGIGGFDPAVELAFLGAYALLLHCPDGCALMDGGKKLHALTLIASVVDANIKPLCRFFHVRPERQWWIVRSFLHRQFSFGGGIKLYETITG